jgi:Mn-dependent DtxR family transcriptional regulator
MFVDIFINMPIQKYIERIRYLDFLIRTKATGTVMQLAKKLDLSEPGTMKYIKEMKELGCPIKYCRKRNSYYYSEEGKVHISFFDKHFDDLKDSEGGGKNCLMNF